MSTGAKNKTNQSNKRKYNTDPASKLKDGKKWEYNCKFDDEVTKKILAENKRTGGEYGFIINKQLRKAYGLKK